MAIQNPEKPPKVIVREIAAELSAISPEAIR